MAARRNARGHFAWKNQWKAPVGDRGRQPGRREIKGVFVVAGVGRKQRACSQAPFDGHIITFTDEKNVERFLIFH